MKRIFTVMVALAPMLPAVVAGCSSSSPGKGGGGSSSGSGGGSSGFPSSSSGAGSSGGGSSGGGSSGGGSSGASSSSGSSGGGDTPIASDVGGIRALTIVGSSLVWIDAPSKAIESVPTSGGTAKQVLTDPKLGIDLATDGTSIFFVTTAASGLQNIESAAPDGTGRKVISSGYEILQGSGNDLTGLFQVNGNLYFAANAVGDSGIPGINWGIYTVPTSGGTVSVVPGGGGGWASATLAYADASGLYFGYGTTQSTGGPSYLPLAGGTPTTIGTLGSNNVMAVAGGYVYAPISNGTALSTTLMKSAVTGGAAVTLATYPNEEGATIVGDSAGLYMMATGGNSGMYTVDPSTGAQTLIDSGNGGLFPGSFAIDSNTLYFVEGGGGVFSLWSRPR